MGERIPITRHDVDGTVMDGTAAHAVTSADPDDPNDGITTLWRDDGLVTYTSPWHRMTLPPAERKVRS